MAEGERERLAAELKRAIARPQTPARGLTQEDLPESLVVARSKDEGTVPRTRPISFTPALLTAVLKGSKVQTRRPVRPLPHRVIEGTAFRDDGRMIPPIFDVGARLWVQEKWARSSDGFVYERDRTPFARWRSPRFMPRAAARTFLRVTGVRLVRLLAIDVSDSIAEGCAAPDPISIFLELWDSIYGQGEFAAKHDPWVWAVSFELVQ